MGVLVEGEGMKIPAEQDVFSLLSLSVSPAGREGRKEEEEEEEEKLMKESGYFKNPNLTGSTTSPRVDTLREVKEVFQD